MSQIVTAIVSGGLGAALGSVVVALIQVQGRKGESRATAADLVTNAAGRMVDRLDRENAKLRDALIKLTDAVDEIIPALQTDELKMSQLHAMCNEAKRAL